MSEQITCPSCKNWVSSDAQHCSFCGVSLQPAQSSHDVLMSQAPPTDPAPSLLDLESSERTMVSKGPRHASEFDGFELEDDFQPTIQMQGAQVSDFFSQPSQAEASQQLFEGEVDRTQVNLYHNSTPAQQHSGDMWRTPSQDAWESPFPQGYPQQGQGWQAGPQNEQATYSGPLDIARAAAAAPPAQYRNRLLWLLLVLVVAGGLFSLSYVYLLPLITPKQQVKRKVFVVMELETSPKGAAVWVNGRRQQELTPTAVSVRIGRTVQVQLRKKDHKTIDFSWQATAYERKRFFLSSLKPQPRPRQADPPPVAVQKPVVKVRRKIRVKRRPRVRRKKYKYPVSILSVRTVPSGATVLVSGKRWKKKTPARIVLRKGQRSKITVQKYGHQDAFFIWSAKRNESHTIKLYRHSWYNP